MKKSYFIILCSLLSYSFGYSQEKFQLLFETNLAEISTENETVLNEKLTLFKASFSANYKIEIIGHTDDVGNLFFNKKLSEKRAKAVADFFAKNGIPNYKISQKGVGYNFPVADNDSEEGKTKNRRVEVQFVYENELNLLSIKKFKKKPTSYFFDSQVEKLITYSSGTKISIPKNAFTDEKGNDVLGEIEIRYEEYRKPIDFILSGIPMHVDQDNQRSFFNSGGMFTMLAFQNGKPIHLKPSKDVVVDFKLTENLPNLNFYGLDSLSNKWTEFGKITDGNGVRLQNFLVCGYNEEEEQKCNLRHCESLKLIHKKGIEYADSDVLLSDLANLTDPAHFERVQQAIERNKEKIVSNTHRINVYNKKLSQHKTRFIVRKSEKMSSTTSFKIVVEHPSTSENKKLAKYNWEISNEEITDEEIIFASKWMYCLVEKNKDDHYTITLKDTSTQVVLKNASLDVPNRIKRKKKGKHLENLISNFNEPALNQNQSDSVKENLIVQKNKLEKDLQILGRYRKGSFDREENQKIIDSLDCFSYYSRDIKTKKEQSMDLETWLNYFDENKKMMFERYSNLPENEAYKKCIEAELERERERLRNLELLKQLATEGVKEDNLMQSISINNLGSYNFDVIINNQFPQVLFAEYRVNSTKIEPAFIFLINENINGVFRFDQNRTDYNPSRFIYYPSSKNTLLVFDQNGESYLFSAKKFNLLNSGNSNQPKILNLEKIKNKQMLESEF
ncbi:MAG TPA: OmpA family protein [Flavobacterium sp.]|uniref:OmpA family protein n=1 Tax=unclassified Flavobacterium TaxID=196869 RepID=UPI0025B912F6|nr:MULTISPECIES: OmpA family protein [unclassified Flavobacterium]HRE76325.1 OmpA family protein [Flavobacterium sp.]